MLMNNITTVVMVLDSNKLPQWKLWQLQEAMKSFEAETCLNNMEYFTVATLFKDKKCRSSYKKIFSKNTNGLGVDGTMTKLMYSTSPFWYTIQDRKISKERKRTSVIEGDHHE